MSTDPKIPKKPGQMHEMSRIPGVTPGTGPKPDASVDPRMPEKSIMHYDKTGIYQQIVEADSQQAMEQLERRIELIEAIQRVQLLQTLPETALYFLEQELKFAKFQPKDVVRKIQ